MLLQTHVHPKEGQVIRISIKSRRRTKEEKKKRGSPYRARCIHKTKRATDTCISKSKSPLNSVFKIKTKRRKRNRTERQQRILFYIGNVLIALIKTIYKNPKTTWPLVLQMCDKCRFCIHLELTAVAVLRILFDLKQTKTIKKNSIKMQQLHAEKKPLQRIHLNIKTKKTK